MSATTPAAPTGSAGVDLFGSAPGFRRSSRCTTGACVLIRLTGGSLAVRGNAPDRGLDFPAAAAAHLVRAIAAGTLRPAD